MGDVYYGKGVSKDLIIPVPLHRAPKQEPSVLVGQPAGSAVVTYFETIHSQELYNLFFQSGFYNTELEEDDAFLLDEEEEELY